MQLQSFSGGRLALHMAEATVAGYRAPTPKRSFRVRAWMVWAHLIGMLSLSVLAAVAITKFGLWGMR